uniref:TNFAIP3-interacting protein 3-like isoform X1 n=1 Tax=Petromyzon marinus TaxID=7757 RepID=A0AAJ7SUS3_PETMA|nr:TNFAIP3-interacting protein 3-like isoform X1 [Petromyzon marinus]
MENKTEMRRDSNVIANRDLETKVRVLEEQKRELLDVNIAWDKQYHLMKECYEKKVRELRQKLHEARSASAEPEFSRQQPSHQPQQQRREREASKDEQLEAALDRESRLVLEVARLNRALGDALTLPQPQQVVTPEPTSHWEEISTQNELLRQQVKCYEEDFVIEKKEHKKTCSERDALRTNVGKAQEKIMALNWQVTAYVALCKKEREERKRLQALLGQDAAYLVPRG